jgi:predicted glycosyltransferase
VIPKRAVDGLNLLWHSDLVVSGGGTMNREAAALGVPVYSVFRGTIGAVDRHLQKQGRLILIETREDVTSKITFTYRDKRAGRSVPSSPALTCIVDHIEHVLASSVHQSHTQR